MIKKERNRCLDFMKGVACIAVVFMHCEFPGTLGIIVQCLTRFSVPLFFMTAGYFSGLHKTEVSVNKMRKKEKHILSIIIWACILYAVFTIVKNCLIDEVPVLEFLKSRLTMVDWINFIIFNQPIIVAGHLWFLFALLYCYLFAELCIRRNIFKQENIIVKMIVITLVSHFILGQGLYIIRGESIASCYYRNFLFDGMPFFWSGVLMKKSEDKWKNYYSNKQLVLCFLAGSVLCILERIWIGRDFSLHIGAIFQVFALLLLALNNSKCYFNKLIERIGRDYSLYVYVLHMIILSVISIGAGVVGLSENTVFLYTEPILVVTCSVIFATILKKVEDMKKGREKWISMKKL